MTYKKLSNLSRAEKMEDIALNVDLVAFLNELKFIFDNTKLQLMDSSQNIKKGKK